MATVLPGTKATYQIFDKEKFALMKKGAFFINAGRGSAVAVSYTHLNNMTNNIKETIKVTHISIQVDNLLGIKLPPKHHCYF